MTSTTLPRPAAAGILLRTALLTFALALVVSACSRRPPAICPRVAILDQGAYLTVFRPGAPKVDANIAYSAEITDIAISCRYTNDTLTTMEAYTTTTIVVRKGPAMQGGQVTIRYFIAVTDLRGAVLSKRVFNRRISLGNNQAVKHTHESWQSYDLRKGGSGTSFETWTSFQLTDDQLEHNRKRLKE
jgi:hypothetical protein